MLRLSAKVANEAFCLALTLPLFVLLQPPSPFPSLPLSCTSFHACLSLSQPSLAAEAGAALEKRKTQADAGKGEDSSDQLALFSSFSAAFLSLSFSLTISLPCSLAHSLASVSR